MKSVRRRVPESSWVRAGQWACLVMSLVSLPTWAGPPFLTDDPEPVDPLFRHQAKQLDLPNG